MSTSPHSLFTLRSSLPTVYCLLFTVHCLLLTAHAAYPEVTLTNGALTARVYLPDANNGYYRGPRFDWSGMIAQVEYKGHTFFGELKGPHNPVADDHGCGPCEEFGMREPFGPLGFRDAAEGATFIKIGVGHLVKAGTNYWFNGGYRIAEPGRWTIAREGQGRLRFEQSLTHGGWGYVYSKELALTSEPPALRIAHTLRNTGTNPISTDHYSHNMFIFDRVPIAKAYRLVLPFAPKASPAPPAFAVVRGNVIELSSGMFWTALTGFSTPADNGARIEAPELGLALEIATDRVPAKYELYSEPTALCPEPFIVLDVKPGESVTWTTQMRFSTAAVKGGGGK